MPIQKPALTGAKAILDQVVEHEVTLVKRWSYEACRNVSPKPFPRRWKVCSLHNLISIVVIHQIVLKSAWYVFVSAQVLESSSQYGHLAMPESLELINLEEKLEKHFHVVQS